MKRVLLTGATGYIGSHTWVALKAAGFEVVGLDDFSNSSPQVLGRLAELMGETPVFVQGDVNDGAALDALFAAHAIDAVVHFAAFKAVGESTAQPLKYYANNIGGLVTVHQAMARAGVKHFVFSSSATVYGEPQFLPYTEAHPLAAMNVYGRTKLMGEQILRDAEAADPALKVAYLRYFNPVGAHESGRIGEDPRGVPNNLMPYVTQVAVGRRERLGVFGGDYDTHDGTGVRDYLHVMDLAEGHVAAVSYLLREQQSLTVNLGTGQGISVLDLVKAFERASGRPIPYDIAPRRPGDLPAFWADATLARERLGWQASRSLDQMCADSWRWQQANPQGFEG
ncbi:UDP-glucose 4-epimerase GalE [Ideonella paludis]|uniref:UDP-glucose 4-epimerase GalE n=1 Tax=Ideonella paludis TaxID=1233411 RepID=UPI00287393B1|nr:UDP-glucose 4-epimerase GalE [Ideonella paludis]